MSNIAALQTLFRRFSVARITGTLMIVGPSSWTALASDRTLPCDYHGREPILSLGPRVQTAYSPRHCVRWQINSSHVSTDSGVEREPTQQDFALVSLGQPPCAFSGLTWAASSSAPRPQAPIRRARLVSTTTSPPDRPSPVRPADVPGPRTSAPDRHRRNRPTRSAPPPSLPNCPAATWPCGSVTAG